ncbi:hypothetical protein [Polluticoccus soli]|uniref:hypothetical protein n=1 Tax=Polluticoccus soli TaxID=3034150 RepID=UPI0023E1C47F|nr:hypothetical protein [Flavipsychrobacter sp. JY13-12]
MLIVGIDPYLIDFTSAEYAAFPSLNAQKVEAGIKNAVNHLTEKGYKADVCWTDFGNSATDILRKKLQLQPFDSVLIGAGIRVPEQNFLLFEQLINIVHQYAPSARICFNTHPGDTVIAVERSTTNLFSQKA